MAARMTPFSRYFNLFSQNTPILHCLKAYKPGLKTRVCAVAFSYEVRSERLEEIAKSPSGWVPPLNPPPSLPFEIKRSRTNNLPVYVDKKRGGSLVLTVIRNIKGDLNELVRFLKENLGEEVHFQTNEITSQVKIKGYHKEAVVRLLKEHGF
ncbi:39S ribosomal L49, mitochondrial [Paramuricea clavata]|uniref:Large ribosomal subunit protein mL49 n=1 Tax=Paramuricea clavata TaxID=317549 RepID=A0A7D9HI39_PARCT|nr:39S ribosomal L49, mitochondrial [Paramuricea clavata]